MKNHNLSFFLPVSAFIEKKWGDGGGDGGGAQTLKKKLRT